jgi:hypothetical protein
MSKIEYPHNRNVVQILLYFIEHSFPVLTKLGLQELRTLLKYVLKIYLNQTRLKRTTYPFLETLW